MKINLRAALTRLLAVLATLGLSTLCNAQQHSTDIPRILSYQGQLRSNTGLSVDGPQTMTIRLYSDSAGQQVVWEDKFLTPVQSGVFNILLGSQRPLPDASELSAPLWVGVTIGEGNELKPYTQLSASPYALTVANHSITADKMDVDYIGSISVNSTKVTARGGDLNIITGPGLAATFDPTSNSLILEGSDNGIVSRKGKQTLGSTQVIGTNHQVLCDGTYGSARSGNVTLTTPQDIHTGASPTFVSLTLTGNASIGGTLGVTGNSSLGGTLGVTGATTTHGITNTGNIGTGTLTSTGNITDGGNLTVAGTTGLTGNTTIAGTLLVSGGTTTNGVTNTGDIGTTTLTSSSTIADGGNLTVAGTTGLTGNTTIAGTLLVWGGTTTNGVTNAGLLTTDSLHITGGMTIVGSVHVAGGIDTLVSDGPIESGNTLIMNGTSLPRALTSDQALLIIAQVGNVTITPGLGGEVASTSNLDMLSHNIINVSDPVNSQDAATMHYALSLNSSQSASLS